ncbi:MAG: nicotinate phosphoribosyltransferase [Burkholderiales bacterium]
MNPLTSPLLTDLYQLTMLNAYRVHRMNDTAVFELFVRKLPRSRNFLMAAGLEQALVFLEQLKFLKEELDWVRANKLFGQDFAEYLGTLRFTGEVHAMPEGTVFFSDEPILRITAPLPEAQLVETRLINLVQFESMVAAKAARCVLTAPGKQLVDFGLRRAHGAEAGLLAARAAYVAGFSGTATVLAAANFGIPVFGTMAHSFIQAHDDERDAFARFAEVYPKGTTLLIDTYDTEEAARKLVPLALNLAARGVRVGGVRLDSGDLAQLSKSVRAILDQGGLGRLKIFASGNLDEYRIAELLAAGAPIDGYGIGTSLVTSYDAASLDAVYKLEEYAGKPRRKRSAAKATWPGRKQVFREYDAAGRMQHDVVSVETDRCPGEPLLVRVMAHGRRLPPFESLADIRARAESQLARLPQELRSLDSAAHQYPVKIAPALKALARKADALTAELPALVR